MPFPLLGRPTKNFFVYSLVFVSLDMKIIIIALPGGISMEKIKTRNTATQWNSFCLAIVVVRLTPQHNNDNSPKSNRCLSSTQSRTGNSLKHIRVKIRSKERNRKRIADASYLARQMRSFLFWFSFPSLLPESRIDTMIYCCGCIFTHSNDVYAAVARNGRNKTTDGRFLLYFPGSTAKTASNSSSRFIIGIIIDYVP